MYSEEIKPNCGILLRRNGSERLMISINEENLKEIFLINNTRFLAKNINPIDLEIAPYNYYMIINKSDSQLHIQYNLDISLHQIVYDPYKYKDFEKIEINPEEFIRKFYIPPGFIDILPKWYSIKFTYPDHNLIFIKPEMGISIQTHTKRSEYWEIIEGSPIIINGNEVHYFVESGSIYKHSIGAYHSIFNPNKQNEYVIIKEKWSGDFDEEDIQRLFSPNL